MSSPTSIPNAPFIVVFSTRGEIGNPVRSVSGRMGTLAGLHLVGPYCSRSLSIVDSWSASTEPVQWLYVYRTPRNHSNFLRSVSGHRGSPLYVFSTQYAKTRSFVRSCKCSPGWWIFCLVWVQFFYICWERTEFILFVFCATPPSLAVYM